MPIYEYICEECDHSFELLLQSSGAPACPECHSRKLEKQFSTFAPGNGSEKKDPSQALPDCPTCGIPGGTCGLN